MPELPEVETVMRALARRLEGRSFRSVMQHRPDLRFPMPPGLRRRLEGRRLVGFRRRAKFITIDLDDGRSLLLHLGMSGRLVFDGEAGGKHEHVTFGFDDGTVLRFVDPRRFGMLDLAPTAELVTHRWLAGLGLEPLGEEFDEAALLAMLRGRRIDVKTAIMDQRRLVGVGNIYASEALFRSAILPTKPATDFTADHAARLVPAIKTVLNAAIDAGGSSLRDYVQASGELGNFQRNFLAYGREGEPCVACGQEIRRIVQGGRSTFFCAVCQR